MNVTGWDLPLNPHLPPLQKNRKFLSDNMSHLNLNCLYVCPPPQTSDVKIIIRAGKPRNQKEMSPVPDVHSVRFRLRLSLSLNDQPCNSVTELPFVSLEKCFAPNSAIQSQTQTETEVFGKHSLIRL